jgi:hypothetical protein
MCHIIVTLKSHKFDNQYITIEKLTPLHHITKDINQLINNDLSDTK